MLSLYTFHCTTPPSQTSFLLWPSDPSYGGGVMIDGDGSGAAAILFCAADEAALCRACDEKRRYYNVVEEDPPVQTAAHFWDELGSMSYTSTNVKDDPDAVDVNHADMACLAPEAYLSSTIMNFYIRYLQQPTSLSESTTSNYHFFSTYFYNKLEKVRKWWKDVSILEKAYILLPVHESAHWSLVIICFPTKEDEQGPILLHYDSLGLHNSNLYLNIIRFIDTHVDSRVEFSSFSLYWDDICSYDLVNQFVLADNIQLDFRFSERRMEAT
ncbi:peptidase C48, SUMO/sentrin/Ubl1 [Tanacetum coccineum]